MLTVNDLSQCPMEESILDVQLVNQPRARPSQCKNKTDCGRLDDWTKSLLIINPWALSETSKHPPGLVTIKRAISQKLVTINPFTGDDVNTGWTGNQSLGVVGQEGIKLVLHRCSPVWIS